MFAEMGLLELRTPHHLHGSRRVWQVPNNGRHLRLTDRLEWFALEGVSGAVEKEGRASGSAVAKRRSLQVSTFPRSHLRKPT